MQWKEVFGRYAEKVEDSFSDLAHSFKTRMGYADPVQVLPYRTYGTVNRLYLKGRVLEDEKIARSTDKDTLLNNLLNMYKRFESDEVAGAKVKALFDDKEHHSHTDDEGYYHFNLIPEKPVFAEELWHMVDLELVEVKEPYTAGYRAKAEVLIPPADAEYGVISDIDDTILQTGATNLLAMARSTFLNNARTRMPFAGVKEFYKALQLGRNGKMNNPFFYVSSSPWNLYDLLREFMDLNGIPPGPLLLRDYDVIKSFITKSDGGHLGHKYYEIEQVLKTYPHLKFVLVGDSGQEDPAIYREVVKNYPDRILAIYIRDVQVAEREQIAIDVSKEISEHEVEMVIVDNTSEAAEHALNNGLIISETLPEIEEEKQQDKGQIAGKEEAEL